MKEGEIPVDVKLKAIEDKFDSFKKCPRTRSPSKQEEQKRLAEEQENESDYRI